jgi:hypothetical protein
MKQLPDFKDQARSGIAPRIADVTDANHRLPNYKNQATSQTITEPQGHH